MSNVVSLSAARAKSKVDDDSKLFEFESSLETEVHAQSALIVEELSEALHCEWPSGEVLRICEKIIDGSGRIAKLAAECAEIAKRRTP